MSVDYLIEEIREASAEGTPMSDHVIIARLCGVITHLERRVEVLENALEHHKDYHPGPGEIAW